jgi:hypothetical protein
MTRELRGRFYEEHIGQPLWQTNSSVCISGPPALYPNGSDVRDTERIPYPPEWESLLNSYIQEGTSETAYEDGVGLVLAFFRKVELCRILHRMTTEVFENRNVNAGDLVLATSVKEIHVSLAKWLADIPAKLHWNQWVVGHVPSLVLHLQSVPSHPPELLWNLTVRSMLYHTSMIILHRPPRQSLCDPSIATSKDIEIC